MHASTKVHLVSFADGPFAPRKPQFLKEANEFNVFDSITILNASMLSQSFLKQHLSFMESQKRGFGYWIWKPQVIEAALEHSPPGDLVVYLDAGFTLNPGGKTRFLEYLDIALDSQERMLSFQNIHTEYIWTKADLASRLGVHRTPHVMNTSQLSSGFIIIGVTKSNIDLVSEWKQLAVEDAYRYSDDSPSIQVNHPRFREHRHDQSIFSLLRKMRGTAITHYEVQSYANYFDNLKPLLPTWATRLRK